MNSTIVKLDVREDIRSGGNPFSKIMKAVSELTHDETLAIVAPFEPLPLISLLATRGLSHTVTRTDTGDWQVLFARADGDRDSAISPPTVAYQASSQTAEQQRFEIDARGLEPPQPMMRILEALVNLPNTASLIARTDRRPMHLYAQLETRGFKAETEAQADGSFVTCIQRS